MNKLPHILIIIIVIGIIFLLLNGREPEYLGEFNSVQNTEVSD